MALMPFNSPIPATSTLRLTTDTSHSTSMPSVSAMSTMPHLDVMALAPCLAMWTPPAAATTADRVLTLKVLMRSMPVPQFSTRYPSTSGRALAVSISKIASQAPAISSGVGLADVSAARKAPCWRSGCWFSRTSRNMSLVLCRPMCSPLINASTDAPNSLSSISMILPQQNVMTAFWPVRPEACPKAFLTSSRRYLPVNIQERSAVCLRMPTASRQCRLAFP